MTMRVIIRLGSNRCRPMLRFAREYTRKTSNETTTAGTSWAEVIGGRRAGRAGEAPPKIQPFCGLHPLAGSPLAPNGEIIGRFAQVQIRLSVCASHVPRRRRGLELFP